jgi:hypothetical protein
VGSIKTVPDEGAKFWLVGKCKKRDQPVFGGARLLPLAFAKAVTTPPGVGGAFAVAFNCYHSGNAKSMSDCRRQAGGLFAILDSFLDDPCRQTTYRRLTDFRRGRIFHKIIFQKIFSRAISCAIFYRQTGATGVYGGLLDCD